MLKLHEVRHPCLEMQDEVSYIPNDAIFDKGLFDLLIYNSKICVLLKF